MNPSEKQKVILLVDDEPNVLRALRRELAPALRQRGVSVVTATSGPDCLAILEERHHAVALLISDLRMPKMNGGELVRRVNDAYPDIALMLLTAYSDAEELSPTVSAIIQACLLKPWDHEHLLSRIEDALTEGDQRTDSA